MATQRKVFRRIGIRRDKNFGDLGDSVQGLNNLLDTLVDTPDGTFISQDLDSIRGIASEGLDSDEYQNFIGSAVQQTDTTGTSSAIFPRISYQNRLDKFEFNAGEPRINGGNGLTAKYYNYDQVQNTTEIFTGVSTSTLIPSDTFWEAGNFNYTGKIHPQSINSAGGAQWEGFFIPTQTGQYNFNTSASMGFTMDFEADGYSGTGIGTYTEYARVGLAHTVTSATTTPNTVTVPTASAVNIGIGMSVTGSGIRTGTKVESINRSTGAIALENPDGDSIQTANGSVSVSFKRNAGENARSSFTTQTLEQFRRYRIRARFFVYPGIDIRGLEKSIDFNFSRPGGTDTDLRYNNLYSLDYDFSDAAKGSFSKFLDQSLLFGGNKQDGTERIGGTVSNNYVRVTSTKKVDIKYKVKTTKAAVERKSFTGSWSTNSKIINLSDTTNLEIGNYLFAGANQLTASATTPVRIVDIVTNEFLIIDTPTTNSSGGATITALDHRGFVKKVTASGSSGTISISGGNTNDMKTGQIAIWDGVNAYTGITTNGTSNSFTVFPSQGFGSRSVYIYESRGLVDKALNAFCIPSQTRCVLVTNAASVGDTSLTVESTTGYVDGMTIQGFNFASGTTITVTGATSITLSTGITKNINPGSNFTVTSLNDDRSLCCPPTDTSPPFNPTEEGLETTNGEPNFEITGGALKFDELSIPSISASKITEITNISSEKSNNRLTIRAGDGVDYKILCV